MASISNIALSLETGMVQGALGLGRIPYGAARAWLQSPCRSSMYRRRIIKDVVTISQTSRDVPHALQNIFATWDAEACDEINIPEWVRCWWVRRSLNPPSGRSPAPEARWISTSTIMSTRSSVFQHLRATKEILQGATLRKKYVWVGETRRVGELKLVFAGSR